MKFQSRSAFGRVDIVVSNGIEHVAPLAPWPKDRPAARRAAVIPAFVAGLVVAAVGTWAADAPVRPQPTAERAGADIVRVQPTAKQFAPPNQPDFSPSNARDIDILYRQLIGPPPATSSSSRLRAAPSDDAAGSLRHWASPR
jgi:hypothetical protein